MKTTLLKISFIFLFLSLIGAGCEKEDADEDIPLEYIKCPCDHDVDFLMNIEIHEVLLFDASKTSWDEMRSTTFDGETSQFVSYEKDTKSAKLFTIRGAMTGISELCNFPTTKYTWEIPLSGERISFSADSFNLCMPKGSTTNTTYSNWILTTLKRKIK